MHVELFVQLFIRSSATKCVVCAWWAHVCCFREIHSKTRAILNKAYLFLQCVWCMPDELFTSFQRNTSQLHSHPRQYIKVQGVWQKRNIWGDHSQGHSRDTCQMCRAVDANLRKLHSNRLRILCIAWLVWEVFQGNNASLVWEIFVGNIAWLV